ncbi:hypothetical protein R5H30_11690 [Sulfitobacter sp. D35]|uniref:hypothetical protein n=1 Tax=Sulfitobacter sp. D35 TaxID=3083252 RepID=UPI00296FDCEE|nr:hypothetical protein [Sulfitobacter sp. D35]MDW4498647.1 hypothetical protein [Sulfitobacter sp. D35]
METNGIDRETMLASLHDIRLPPTASGGLLADLLVAVALGLLAAFAVALVLPWLSRPRTPTGATSLAERAAELRDLPETDRALALLHLGREAGLDLTEARRDRLYAPGVFPEARALQARLLQAEHADG